MIQGHGEKACIFLNTLADLVLKIRNYSWKEFIYPSEINSNLNNNIVSNNDVEEDIDELNFDQVVFLPSLSLFFFFFILLSLIPFIFYSLGT